MPEASQTISLVAAHVINQRPSDQWFAGPTSPILTYGEVHVWRVTLDERSANFDKALAENDRTQAARFRFNVDRERFLNARASLRMTLGRYLETAPHALQFGFGAHGKPALGAAQNNLDLRFNLSHSHEFALIAITLGREIGVDIEYMRADFAGDEIAARFFSQNEIAQLDSVAPESRVTAFFDCWTRKEAYIKARGEGLSFPLNQFDVSLGPHSRAVLLGNRLDPTETSRWVLRELSPAPNYAAAIAVEKGCEDVRFWSFDPGS